MELPDLLPPIERERPKALKILYGISILLLVAAGVIAWLIPILPSTPFYVTAALLVAAISDRGRCAINRAERRLPTPIRLGLRRVHDRIQRTS